MGARDDGIACWIFLWETMAMLFSRHQTFSKNEVTAWPVPNYWDLVALCLVLGVLVLLAWGMGQMATPYHVGQALPISLDPHRLPVYALRTVLRMLIAMLLSLLFTFTIGTWAAKSRQAEKLIIPMIDILQSVPILSFLAITVTGFLWLFPGSLLGPECAAIFVIFTSQAWNMTLSFYQSLRTLPHDLREASTMFHLSAWQRFWRVEVPFAMPALLWNVMMSMSGSWVFVTASEAISVANQHITLPGLGSYIALAITQADKSAIAYVILVMLFVIFFYDQLLFRPLVQWSWRFRLEVDEEEQISRCWMAMLFQRTRLVQRVGDALTVLFDFFVNLPFLNIRRHGRRSSAVSPITRRRLLMAWDAFLWCVVIATIVMIIHFVLQNISQQEIRHVFYLGLLTGTRVMVLIFLCSLVWIPVGVWIGRRPRLAELLQPIIQFCAAFPANLLFPVAAFFILRYQLNINVWTSPLMVLGTQWYILFNVIAGTLSMPKDLHRVSDNFGVRGWLRWRRLYLPAIFPYYVTGAITAAGGAWNISIIAESVRWGGQQLSAAGLGEYITRYSEAGDFHRIIFGTVVMCCVEE